MKTLTFILFFVITFLVNNAYSNQFWFPQQTPINTRLITCSFPDSTHGWAAGLEGKIIYTSNGGINWIEQNSPVNSSINCIHFINERIGWGVANNYLETSTAVLSTTNGGLNWTMFYYPDTTNIFTTIYFHDSLNGWMSGTSIVRTTNAGANWLTTLNSTPPVTDLKFYNSDLGFACGGYINIPGYILKSTDKGVNWETRTISPEPLNNIFIFDSLNIIAVGGDYEYGVCLTKTTNSGLNWNYNSLSIFGIPTAVSFRTPQEGWIALSFTGNFAYTTNSGINWSEIPSPDSTGIYDISFTDVNHGWAVGDYGIVLRYDTTNTGLKKIIQNNYISSFHLFQNYPNPFNPTTNVKFDIQKTSLTKLIIYDALGREVATLINEQLKAGSYHVDWNGSNYTSGVYFYRLQAEDYKETKKMLLVK
ncbi:T9SS type A sorting domain-containing protein [Bacteroidota bacterium]